MFTNLTKKAWTLTAVIILLSLTLLPTKAQAVTDAELYTTALPYVKYYSDRAMPQFNGDGSPCFFWGLTRNLRTPLAAESTVGQYGADAFENLSMSRILLGNNDMKILNVYTSAYGYITNVDNPILYCGNTYSIKYGAYMSIRILGRLIPGWASTWNWAADTKTTSFAILNLCKAYQLTSNATYLTLAEFLANNNILDLQDGDGGVRLGPDNMFYPGNNHWWYNHKTTESNAYALAAMDALYAVTSNSTYQLAATNIRSWIKSMYDNDPVSDSGLFSASSVWSGTAWVKTPLTYVETAAQALAPIETMFTDTYFGLTQEDRDAAVEKLLNGTEIACSRRDPGGIPALYKFAGDGATYGSIEKASQMALAYLKAAQGYNQRAAPNHAMAAYFLYRYNKLVANIEGLFVVPGDDPASKTAPYAVYYGETGAGAHPNGSLAANLPTGTGLTTPAYYKSLSCAWFGFAKAGYNPLKLDGGPGIPSVYYILNLVDVPWFQLADPYLSTGATSGQMTLNYLRRGAGLADLTQDEIYEYAIPLPADRTRDLKADELNNAMNHFQPGGYHFSTRSFDPATDPLAMNKYMRDICHWIDYQVPGVVRQNVPVSLPILGSMMTYSYWVTIQGFTSDVDPCPADPWTIPDFTVYGYWVKDSYGDLLGSDAYWTADECQSIYFQPISGSGDTYDGKYVLVAEPPPTRKLRLMEKGKARPAPARPDLNNLAFMKAPIPAASLTALKAGSMPSDITINPNKTNGIDMLPSELRSDRRVKEAFKGTVMRRYIPVGIDGKSGTDYYLVPFAMPYFRDQRNGIKAVITVDAKTGAFEGLTMMKPTLFLAVDEAKARELIQKSVRNSTDKKIAALKKTSRFYAQQKAALEYEYQMTIRSLNNGTAQLLWGNKRISPRKDKPYWKIVSGDKRSTYYVGQNGNVVIPSEPDQKPPVRMIGGPAIINY